MENAEYHKPQASANHIAQSRNRWRTISTQDGLHMDGLIDDDFAPDGFSMMACTVLVSSKMASATNEWWPPFFIDA